MVVCVITRHKRSIDWYIDPHNIEMSSYCIDILINSSQRKETGIDTQRKQTTPRIELRSYLSEERAAEKTIKIYKKVF